MGALVLVRTREVHASSRTDKRTSDGESWQSSSADTMQSSASPLLCTASRNRSRNCPVVPVTAKCRSPSARCNSRKRNLEITAGVKDASFAADTVTGSAVVVVEVVVVDAFGSRTSGATALSAPLTSCGLMTDARRRVPCGCGDRRLLLWEFKKASTEFVVAAAATTATQSRKEGDEVLLMMVMLLLFLYGYEGKRDDC